MSTRPNLPQEPVMSASMAGDIVGTPTIVKMLSMISYSLSWTGTSPVGVVSIQASNDYALNAAGGVKNAGTWNTLTLNYGGSAVTSVPVSGNTGNGFIDIAATGAYALRPIYTRTSGTGTMTALFNGKVS